MTALRRCFESLTALRKDRLYALSYVEAKPEWKDEFFDLAHDTSADRSAIYAAWVWEFYCLKNLSNYKELLNVSLERLVPLQHSGMRRVHSKILWSFIKEKPNYDALTNSQKEKIITLALDWLMTKIKTAPLSFCIRILGCLQNEFPYVRKHLEDLILNSQRTFPTGVFPSIRKVMRQQ